MRNGLIILLIALLVFKDKINDILSVFTASKTDVGTGGTGGTVRDKQTGTGTVGTDTNIVLGTGGFGNFDLETIERALDTNVAFVNSEIQAITKPIKETLVSVIPKTIQPIEQAIVPVFNEIVINKPLQYTEEINPINTYSGGGGGTGYYPIEHIYQRTDKNIEYQLQYEQAY